MTDSTQEKSSKRLLVEIFFGFVLTILSVVLHAVIASSLWNWFLVPLGVKSIGAVHALGVGILVRYVTHQPTTEKLERLKEEHPFIAQITIGLVWPIFVLGFALLTKRFM